eukprot:gene3522-6169_t
MTCSEIFCTIDFRHITRHFEETNHNLFFSFEENNILCQKCNEIINYPILTIPDFYTQLEVDLKIDLPIIIENIFGEVCEFYKKNDILLMNEISYYFNVQSFKLFDNRNVEVETLVEGNKYHLVGDELPFESFNIEPKFKTGVIFDERVLNHKIDRYHPENPNRVKMILNYFRKSKIMDNCKILKSRKAKIEELTIVHSNGYVNAVINNEKFDHHSDVYFDENTSEAALYASGCVLELLNSIAKSDIDNGFAIVRPPGHHAGIQTAMGFCFFNHVAVAARNAIQNYNMKKVLIFDWDIHHGNGTEEIFYESNDVLFFSIHSYGKFYPGSGNTKDIGNQNGKGFNVNIPLEGSGYGDTEYLMVMKEIVIPILKEFNPDIVIISGGFDAVKGDLLGRNCLSPKFYGQMTQLFKDNSNGKIMLVLEGGYNIGETNKCLFECTKALLQNSKFDNETNK